MVKKKHHKKSKKPQKEKKPFLPPKVKQWILGVVLFLLAVIITLSFFDLAGLGGRALKASFLFLLGKAIFLLPLIFFLGGLVFFSSKKKRHLLVFLAMFILILGVSGLLGSLNSGLKQGGWLGHLIAWPLIKGFGFWVALIIFAAIIIIGGLIVFQLLRKPCLPKEQVLGPEELEAQPLPLIQRIFKPKFKVSQIEPEREERKERRAEMPLSFEAKSKKAEVSGYQVPPLDLLEKDRGVPGSGDIKLNSGLIQKTLQDFDIPVEMAEVNIGPTVTQYTLKPADGIKLSKITALNNDLSLALASHPLRIEAPIPGRPLVGIEVPNKRRVTVRLRNLLESPNFPGSSRLALALGRDVSGLPFYTGLSRMPHLLVAGSTGTGKTICLNSIILTLLYQHGPGLLKFILVDPKRVEFPVYNDLPHLLCPVIFGAQKTINVLKWLTEEMERRFDILAVARARDIDSYNSKAGPSQEPMPYVVLIIDELADLMAARGREIEAGIVRLAQMARAVGIHLVVATQRPSVEVITGLIKANITSRITFQVASQVDSRTVLDAAGAEKLLGQGDMLFLSAEVQKPKRIQAAFVSEREVKKVVQWIKSKTPSPMSKEQEIAIEQPAESLDKALENRGEVKSFFDEQDPLYEEAKRLVFEAKKASASLLQRRLRLGYARAARLLDMLEEDGVIGPAEGAKAREVYLPGDEGDNELPRQDNNENKENDFKEVTF